MWRAYFQATLKVTANAVARSGKSSSAWKISTKERSTGESEGGIWLLNEYADVLTSLETIRVDQGYKAMVVAWVGQYMPCTVEVVEKPADQVGFAVLPERWVVEQTCAWLGRYRQLSKEYDHYPESTESWIYRASIDILLKRLFRDT